MFKIESKLFLKLDNKNPFNVNFNLFKNALEKIFEGYNNPLFLKDKEDIFNTVMFSLPKIFYTAFPYAIINNILSKEQLVYNKKIVMSNMIIDHRECLLKDFYRKCSFVDFNNKLNKEYLISEKKYYTFGEYYMMILYYRIENIIFEKIDVNIKEEIKEIILKKYKILLNIINQIKNEVGELKIKDFIYLYDSNYINNIYESYLMLMRRQDDIKSQIPYELINDNASFLLINKNNYKIIKNNKHLIKKMFENYLLDEELNNELYISIKQKSNIFKIGNNEVYTYSIFKIKNNKLERIKKSELYKEKLRFNESVIAF